MDAVNLEAKFELFNETWTPKIVGELNGQYVKLARFLGELVWHSHRDEDELFLVVKGSITIKLRDGDVVVNEGEFYIVPRGVEHSPVAPQESLVMMFEPKATAHTGDVEHAQTVNDQEWI